MLEIISRLGGEIRVGQDASLGAHRADLEAPRHAGGLRRPCTHHHVLRAGGARRGGEELKGMQQLDVGADSLFIVATHNTMRSPCSCERRLRYEAPHIGAARHRIADLVSWKACGTRHMHTTVGGR